MIHCLIIGAAGMLGAGLVDALLAKGEVAGKPVDKLTLFDIFEAPARDADVALDIRAGDAVFFPANTLGTWEILETARKTYIILDA